MPANMSCTNVIWSPRQFSYIFSSILWASQQTIVFQLQTPFLGLLCDPGSGTLQTTSFFARGCCALPKWSPRRKLECRKRKKACSSLFCCCSCQQWFFTITLEVGSSLIFIFACTYRTALSNSLRESCSSRAVSSEV